MWDRIAAVVLFAAFAADCAVLTLRNVHMLQLNSYRPERYGRWMKAHRPELWRTYGWLLIALAAAVVQPLKETDWTVRAACAGLFAAHLILNWPQKAKKPLVYTPRVRRLLVTHGILLAAVIAAVALTGMYRLGVAGLFLWAVLSPFVTLLALLINQPM